MDHIRVYLITDDKRSRGRTVEEVVSAAVRRGVRCVQYRPWQPDDAQYLETAKRLRDITGEAGALLLINRRTDIAEESRSDGVHLGAGGMSISEARAELGDSAVIAYSAHSLEEAQAAAAAGADFVTLSPVFPTASSSRPRALLGPERIAEANSAIDIPMFALGGVDHSNAGQLLAVGVRRVAVVSCITQAPDVDAAARDLCRIMQQPGI